LVAFAKQRRRLQEEDRQKWRERKRTRSHTVKFQKDVRRKPPATKTLATRQRLIEARGQ
jgi:hypothetical protein